MVDQFSFIQFFDFHKTSWILWRYYPILNPESYVIVSLFFFLNHLKCALWRVTNQFKLTTHNPLLQTILLKYSLYKSLLESKFPVAIFLFLCLLNHCHFVQSNVPTGGASIRTAKQFWATILLYYDGKNFCGKKFSWIKISHESFRFLRNLFSWTWKKLLKEIIFKGTVKIHF